MKPMMIDLRRDTVTQPTSEMKEAMLAAPLGDDVFGDDPTVNSVQQRIASYFGFEHALFCPSGTMANRIALNTLTRPGDEVLCHKLSHIYRYEGGGMTVNSGLPPKLLEGDRRIVTVYQIIENVNTDVPHSPRTRSVVLENTMNKGGGCRYKREDLVGISRVCLENNLPLHMDGARLFNVLIATGQDPKLFSGILSTLSVCFSKGMGYPAGSVLLGSRKTIKQAIRVRKSIGGAMLQTVMFAVACDYAMGHHIIKLKKGHKRAIEIKRTLMGNSLVEQVLPVETIIVISRLSGKVPVAHFIETMDSRNIKLLAFGRNHIRMLTYFGFNDSMLDQFKRAISTI